MTYIHKRWWQIQKCEFIVHLCEGDVDMLLVLEKVLKLDEFPLWLEDVFGTFEYAQYKRFAHETKWEGGEDIVNASFLKKLGRFFCPDRVYYHPLVALVFELKLLDEKWVNLEDAEIGFGSDFFQKRIGECSISSSKLDDMNIFLEINRTDHLFV